ncbi:MAG: ThiF family adenylyltransferase, partial [Desulfobulbus sp.]
MTFEFILALTTTQHDTLRNHLFPGDGCEAIAIVLCGRRISKNRQKFFVREIHPVPHEQCAERSPVRLTWSTEILVPLIKKAKQKGWSILKIHSHLDNDTHFSPLDDISDRDLFPSVYGWMDDDLPHISAIMQPTGCIMGRIVTSKSNFIPLTAVHLVGDDLIFWRTNQGQVEVPEYGKRVSQAFGKG